MSKTNDAMIAAAEKVHGRSSCPLPFKNPCLDCEKAMGLVPDDTSAPPTLSEIGKAVMVVQLREPAAAQRIASHLMWLAHKSLGAEMPEAFDLMDAVVCLTHRTTCKECGSTTPPQWLCDDDGGRTICHGCAMTMIKEHADV